MARKGRVPGGTHNEKSGQIWSKEEIVQVYLVYRDLGGKAIHENNPAIRQLAARLGRTTRAVEAQALMFRNLERGGDYSFGNMNKLCKEVWEEMEHLRTSATPGRGGTTDAVTPSDTAPPRPFPDGLLAWAAEGDSGVRRPFDDASGRAVGAPVDTAVLLRIRTLVQNMASHGQAVRAVFLVGGPGNGKTDAIESLVEAMDTCLGFEGALVQKLKTLYAGAYGRRVTVHLDDVARGRGDTVGISDIDLVHDASESGDDAMGAADTLVRDLEGVAGGNDSRLYVCCANRGILDMARLKALTAGEESSSYKLLERITASIHPKPKPLDCWPLAGYGHVYVWPMDAESLFANVSEETRSPASRLLDFAVACERWTSRCEAGDMCPFHANLRLLQNPVHKSGLLMILRNFEISSGKRWTFRELLALLSHILVGPTHLFAQAGTSPCDWAAERARELEHGSSIDKLRAALLLASKLYYHALFPLWRLPRDISSRDCGTCKREWGNATATAPDLVVALRERTVDRGSEIAKIVTGPLAAMDPAFSTNGFAELPSLGVSFQALEREFSISVRRGAKLCGALLDRIELTALSVMDDADHSLDDSEEIRKNMAAKARRYQGVFRNLACRLAKRSIGTRFGIGRDGNLYEEYIATLGDVRRLGDVTNRLRNLFRDPKTHMFSVSLGSALGPALKPPTEDAVLGTHHVPFRPVVVDSSPSRPRWAVGYAEILHTDVEPGIHVPITYDLHKALKTLAKGLLSAGLPSGVSTSIESTRSLAGGRLVRTQAVLDDPETKITLGHLTELHGPDFDSPSHQGG